jgi:hypothetical protein
VRLELDVDPVDRFGRTLAYVHRAEDDLDVGLQLATDGYALQLTVPPNVAREAAIAVAVAAARGAGRGLWGPACAEPQAIAPVTEPPTTAAPPPPTEPPTTATPRRRSSRPPAGATRRTRTRAEPEAPARAEHGALPRVGGRASVRSGDHG